MITRIKHEITNMYKKKPTSVANNVPNNIRYKHNDRQRQKVLQPIIKSLISEVIVLSVKISKFVKVAKGDIQFLCPNDAMLTIT